MTTGSSPKVFSLGDDQKVYTAEDVLLEKKDCGAATVIIGGGLVGCETALWLAKKGMKVTIVKVMDKLLVVKDPICHANSEMLEKLMTFYGIEVITGAKAKEFTNGELKVEIGSDYKSIPCDSIVFSVTLKKKIRFIMSWNLMFQRFICLVMQRK